jgi:hypothetical protein
LGFLALFVLEILVPERVGKEVEADTRGASFKEPDKEG